MLREKSRAAVVRRDDWNFASFAMKVKLHTTGSTARESPVSCAKLGEGGLSRSFEERDMRRRRKTYEVFESKRMKIICQW